MQLRRPQRGLLLLTLALAVSGMLLWLLTTESGLRWAWGRTEAALDGRLTAAQVSGRLLGPLRVEGLHLTQGGLDLAMERVALDWHPGWLLRGRLALRNATVEGVVVTLGEAGPAEAAPLQRLVLPLGLSLDETVVRDITVLRPEAAPLVVDELRLGGDWQGTRLQLTPSFARGTWGRIDLEGRLATGPGRESDLKAQWALAIAEWQVDGAGRLTGTFAEPRATLRLSAPAAFSASASAAWQESPPRWQAEFDLPPLVLSALRAEWPELTLGGRGHLAGQGTAFTATVDGAMAEARAGQWDFDGRLATDAAGWQLERLALRPRPGSGEVVLAGDWAGPGSEPRFQARWQDFSHPLLAGWRSDGSLEGSGLPEAYHGRLSLDADHDAVPPIEVSTNFAGDMKGVKLTSLDGRWLGGDWRGEAVLGWTDGFDWQARLQVEGADPGQFDARFAGALAGEAESSGTLRDGRLRVALPRLELKGTVAERPLRLSSAATLSGDLADWNPQLTLERLELASGGARVTARGEAGAVWGLRWRLAADRLADLWPGAAGWVRLRGRIEGPQREPHLRLNGSARSLAWAGAALAEARLEADVDLAGAVPWTLDLQLRGAERGALWLDALHLHGGGQAAGHEVGLELRGMDGSTLALEARGAWAEGRWEGELRGGRLELAEIGTWQATRAQLEVGADGGRLERWCWQGEGALCLAATGVEGRWQGAAELAEVPLALVGPWLPRSGMSAAGTLGGTLTATAAAGVVSELTARLEVIEGRLRYGLGEGMVESVLRLVRLDVDGNGEGLAARLDVEAVDGNTLTARLALPGWMPGQPLAEAQPVQGSFDLEAEHLLWLTYLQPNLLQPRGRLQVHVRLAGSVGDPALSGTLELRDGDVLLPAAGIHLTELSLEGRSTDGRTLSLSGSARSGPGRLAVSGRLISERLGHWRAEVALKGEQFELVRLVQARALVSPDLQMVLEQGLVEVKGQLTVPQADVNLPRLPRVVEVSPDEVILDAEEEAELLRRWRMVLDLRLVAGDRVRLEGYGFSGRLAGAIALRGETPGLTRAQGELTIHDGRYEAYGQNLVVQRGRLLFADSPPENPGLDIRAVRPLPDPEQVVGVEVSGRLRDPRLRLFSEPLLEESEGLSWLVLGRPLTATSRTEADTLYRAAFALGGDRAARGIALQFGLDELSVEQGATADEAAVVLGKYLTPRLYLQYAVGLWDTANRLRIRYQLSSRWSLKMEQGEQSGADLLYVIER